MKEVEHMNIELRLETPADYAETEKVVREAFWNVYAPGCTEHYLVHVMRSSENFVRELAFVAVADSKIVSCVMFVKVSDASVNFHFDATRSFHLKIGKIK